MNLLPATPLGQTLTPMVDTLFVTAIFACVGLAVFFHISGKHAWRTNPLWIGVGLVVLWLFVRTALL